MDPFHLGLGEWGLNPQRLARFPYHSGHPIPRVYPPLPSASYASLPPWPPLASGISAMIANLVPVRGVEPQLSGDQSRESRLICLIASLGLAKPLLTVYKQTA